MIKKIRIGDIDIFYNVTGSGRPILLLHGWGGTGESYSVLQKELANFGFRSYALDLPGFGKTTVPEKPFKIDDYAETVRLFAEKLKIKKFYLFGHSFGGRIGIKMAAAHPELLEKLILCSAAGIKRKPGVKNKILLGLAKIGKAIFSLPGLNLLAHFARKVLYKIAGSYDYMETSGAMREIIKNALDEDLAPYLEKISVPTLILWGKKDRVTPVADGEIMHEEIKSSIFEIIEDGRHAIHKTHAGKVASFINEFAGHTNN